MTKTSRAEDRRSEPQPRPAEEILRSEHVDLNRKRFTITLRQNHRGQFLKISEDVHGRRNSIIVPLEGYEEFMDCLDGFDPNPSPSGEATEGGQ